MSQSEQVDKNQIGDRGNNNHKYKKKSNKKKQSIEYISGMHIFLIQHHSTFVSHRSVWRVFECFYFLVVSFVLFLFLFLLPSFLPFLFIFLFVPISIRINQRLRTPRMAFLIQRIFPVLNCGLLYWFFPSTFSFFFGLFIAVLLPVCKYFVWVVSRLNRDVLTGF